jgi:hypothetical protein
MDFHHASSRREKNKSVGAERGNAFTQSAACLCIRICRTVVVVVCDAFLGACFHSVRRSIGNENGPLYRVAKRVKKIARQENSQGENSPFAQVAIDLQVTYTDICWLTNGSLESSSNKKLSLYKTSSTLFQII